MRTLKLGHYDQGAAPDSWRAYLHRYHEPAMRDDAFRGDTNGHWRTPTALSGTPVADLQHDLETLGYLPQGRSDGIFGYRTLAAVRLFQEYTRTIGGQPDLGAPDGVVGRNTRTALDRALATGSQSRWTLSTDRQDGPWLALLDTLQGAYRRDYEHTLPTLFDRASDTLPPAQWHTGPLPVHLIGIRRSAWAASLDDTGRRLNNDVFVVIANGRVMRFFGSTDPDPHWPSHTAGMPFLCKGQHNYRFGFHRLAGDAKKCYRALRPATNGIRVVRDSDGDKTLSPGDELDAAPNTTINVHWSGRGTTNWSAGCQVIGGAVYINDDGTTIDCWEHAAIGYAGLNSAQGRGAYDVMMSWITVCAPDITTDGRVPYTLIEENDLSNQQGLHEATIGAFASAARTVALHDNQIRRLIMERAPHLLT